MRYRLTERTYPLTSDEIDEARFILDCCTKVARSGLGIAQQDAVNRFKDRFYADVKQRLGIYWDGGTSCDLSAGGTEILCVCVEMEEKED